MECGARRELTQDAPDAARAAGKSGEFRDLPVGRDLPLRNQRDDLPDLFGNGGFVGMRTCHDVQSLLRRAADYFPWTCGIVEGGLKLSTEPAYSGLERRCTPEQFVLNPGAASL